MEIGPVNWTLSRGVVMDDYESQYEEYKQDILQNRRLRNELHEKYQGSLRVEKDYVDENGVLWKIGLLGVVCGFCFALIISLVDSGLWFFGTVSIITFLGSLGLAQHISSKFKKNLGEMIFYAFRYHQHFKDHIQEERDKEAYRLERDIFQHYDAIRWREDSIQTMSEEDAKSLLLYHIEKMGDFQKRYNELSRFDRFAGSLKNDWYFNVEIQKDIDKYL